MASARQHSLTPSFSNVRNLRSMVGSRSPATFDAQVDFLPHYIPNTQPALSPKDTIFIELHGHEDAQGASQYHEKITSSPGSLPLTPISASNVQATTQSANSVVLKHVPLHMPTCGRGRRLQYDTSSFSNKENDSPSAVRSSPQLKRYSRRHAIDPVPVTERVLDFRNTELALSLSSPLSGHSYSEGHSLERAQLGLPADFPFNLVPSRGYPSSEFSHDEDDTDSEIELFPSARSRKRTADETPKTPSTSKPKRSKISHTPVSEEDDEEVSSNEDAHGAASQQISLMTPVMKRTRRILDPKNPTHAALIARAPKIGPEVYDSDASESPGDVKETSKPHLFRNVKWGAHALDYSNDADFAREPEFTQFVPGRFELQPDGSVSDQKAKLVIKLTDKHGRKRIFANPPPRDWHNQEAITALNKRTVQQIRRNTNVRFREVVHAYVPEERKWILAHLTAGKPTMGWKAFVEGFNARFEGKVVGGAKGARPHRSHSSLTKEVERFGPQFYARGLVPVASKKAKRE
ncbi:hypothetical protein ACN47E_000175 [Coniothyrium glycines]